MNDPREVAAQIADGRIDLGEADFHALTYADYAQVTLQQLDPHLLSSPWPGKEVAQRQVRVVPLEQSARERWSPRFGVTCSYRVRRGACSLCSTRRQLLRQRLWPIRQAKRRGNRRKRK